ncbi:hypothetical protein LTR55_011544 [Exophiala xenobiotica]|nr:hypothetical protein LTR55_011544 [Exophiala xenobiotica]
MEPIDSQVSGFLGGFGPYLFFAQFILNATGIDLAPFETQLLSFVVVIAGLAYGYPKLLDFVETKLMCHVTLEGSDVSYASAARFIMNTFEQAKGRDLTVRSVRIDEDNDAIPTKDGFADLSKFQWMRQYMPGLGVHWFRYRERWVRLTRSRQEFDTSGRTARDDPWNETLRFSCFGINPEFLIGMLDHAADEYESSILQGMVSIFRPVDKCSCWGRPVTARARGIDTVAMDEVVRTRIRDDMNWFVLNKAWHREIEPGAGFAGFFGLNTYLIPLLSRGLTEDNLANLFDTMPARCLVLCEDIDIAGLTARPFNDGKLETTAESDEDDTKTGGRCNISLGGFLNVIDGVGVSEGRTLMMTTNCIEKLDQALVRPGRIDMTVKFELATDDVAKTLFSRLYKGCPGMTEDLAAAFACKFGGGKNSPAVIQSFIMEYPNEPQEALELADRWIEEHEEGKKETPSRAEKLTYVEVEQKETK